MPWGDKDSQGPWGRPPAGGGPNRPEPGGNPNPGPDFDEWLRRAHDMLKRFFPGGEESGRGFVLLFIIAVLLWLSSGIYFVHADEQGVVMRFGAYHRTTGSGLNYHLPWPIETVETPHVTSINRIEIGYRTGGGRGNESAVGQESLMLTGDENIVDIDFEVQWKIDSAPDYLFNVRDPEDTVKAVAESAMREVIGKSKIASVLAEGKLSVEQDTKQLMQQTLDAYKAGIEVVAVNLLKADPPAEVLDAQRDVQTALADAQTVRNQAEAYSNDILPKARGQAQQMILEAEGYRQAVIDQAEGDASRFLAVDKEYKLAPSVTRKRLYLETMEDVLEGMNKMIIGDKGVVPYLPLPALKPPAPAAEEPSK